MRAQRTVGLVGCGNWGRHILRDLVSLECRVVVVARSPESRKRAEAGGAASLVGDLASLPDVDGVVVASPSVTHGDVIESLLDRDVPIFVEKPMTVDAAAADRIAARAPERVFVMDKWRYHPGIRMLAAIARSGEIGAVLGLRTMRLQRGSPHRDSDAIWHLAPHDLAIALEILGSIPEPRSAAGESLPPADGSLFAILGDSPWVVMEISSRYREHRREIRLHGSEGMAVLSDAYSDHVEILRRGDGASLPPAEKRPIPGEMPLLAELRAFVGCLDGGPPPKSTALEGALVVRTIARLRALAGLDRPRP